MKRCVLVVEASPNAVACGAFSASTLDPIEYFSYPSTSIAQAAASLKHELGKMGLKPVRTLLSVHSSLLSMRLLEIPVEDRKKLIEIISLQAEELFVNGAEGLVIDGMALGGGLAAVAGVAVAELDSQLKALSSSGLGASWAGPALFSKDRVLRKLGATEGVCALIDDDSITVVKGGRPCFFKHLDSVDDLQLSISALESEGVKVERFYSAGSTGLAEKAGIEAMAVPSGFERPSLLAVALNFKEGMKGSVNFLERHRDPSIESSLEFRRKAAFALLSILVLVWGAFVYLRHQNMTAEMKSAMSAMEAGFRELFPGEVPKNPEYALEVKLKELAREKEVLRGATWPLDAMIGLSKAAPAGVRIHETSFAGSTINLASEAASFDEAAAFRDSLSRSGAFRDVTITDTHPAQSGRVRFSVTASLGAK